MDNSLKYKVEGEFIYPEKVKILHKISDCCEFLKSLPDDSIQLICIDPPYNLSLAGWDIYDDYIEWASNWINEAYRVLSPHGNMVIFGGIQFRDKKSGDILDIIQYIRNHTGFKLVNTIVWYYKNGMSARRFFSNRHEEIIWITKSNEYYFDLDSVRVAYSDDGLKQALRDKRLNKENIYKGKNPTNVWEIGRLNSNSKERVGHPMQKPIVIIERLIKALSYPGSYVLDFFAGSGTVGRVCIEKGRHCIMCDNDSSSLKFFKRHISLMKGLGKDTDFFAVKDIEEFFE